MYYVVLVLLDTNNTPYVYSKPSTITVSNNVASRYRTHTRLRVLARIALSGWDKALNTDAKQRNK